MALYRPSELREFLNSLGVNPKKALSQNFLVDANIIKKIITLAAVCANDYVIEIGPGPGALTEALLDQGAHVIAIEKDKTFAKALERLQTDDNRLTIIESDVLEVDITTLKKAKNPLKVVANLPYNITTPILSYLINYHKILEQIVVMVQKEVAERMSAAAGNRNRSSLSVFLEFYGDVSYGFTVKKGCFYPSPKVDSAITKIVFHKKIPPCSEEKFFSLTRTAFGKRRKMLRSSLKELYSLEKILSSCEKNDVSPTSRPEELSLEQWISLFKTLETT